MQRTAVVLSLLLLGCAPAGGSGEAAQPEAESSRADMTIEGVWEIAHLNTPDGPDESFRGHLVVTGDFVCHLRVEKEREGFGEEEGDERTMKAGRLFGQQAAACGRFRREGDRLFVTWLTSTNPGTEGNESEFILQMQRDQISLAPAAAPEFAFVYRRPGS